MKPEKIVNTLTLGLSVFSTTLLIIINIPKVRDILFPEKGVISLEFYFLSLFFLGVLIFIIFFSKIVRLKKNNIIVKIELDEYKRVLNKELDKRLTDVITGISNGQKLLNDLSALLPKVQLYQFSLVILDIENFKKVNDQFGYLKGDELLRLIAQELNSTMRANENIYLRKPDDLEIYRKSIGDDSFFILLKGKQYEIIGFLNRIVDLFREISDQTIKILGQRMEITFTGAIEPIYPEDTAKDLISRLESKFMLTKKKSSKKVIWDFNIEKEERSIEEPDLHKKINLLYNRANMWNNK